MGIAPSIIGHEDNGKFSTPRITRILPKKLDPRSPTEGIFRTPIEVNCTPNDNDMATVSASFDTPRRSKCNANEIIKKLNVDCVDQGSELIQTEVDQVIDQGCINEEETFKLNETKCNCNKSVISDDHYIATKDEVFSASSGNNRESEDEMYFESPMKKMPYLETDIDKIDDKFMSSLYIEHPRVKQLKLKKNNNNKTGAGITESNENGVDSTSEERHSESLTSRIDSLLSFSDFESFDNLSLMVSDNEDVSLTAHHSSISKPTVQDWLIAIEDNCDKLMPFDISTDDEVTRSEISTNRDDIIQSIACTPNSKKNQSLNIVRTPLSCLVQNKISDPVKEGNGSLKKKQWRGIQEERQRRGLSLGDENTPPLQAPLDKVSSAPGKLATRRRHIIDWDQDNPSVVI